MNGYVLNQEVEGAIKTLVELIQAAPRDAITQYGMTWQALDISAANEFRDRTLAATRLLLQLQEPASQHDQNRLNIALFGALMGVILARTVHPEVQFTSTSLRKLYLRINTHIAQRLTSAEDTDLMSQAIQDVALRYEDTLPHRSREILYAVHRSISDTHADISYTMMLFTLYTVSSEARIPGDLSQMIRDVDDDEFDNILQAIVED